MTVGTRGDVQPFLALALALKRAGHQVKLCTHEAHRSLVENWKINFFPLAGTIPSRDKFSIS
jgi:sterol 3beta-glucosyltransferase